MTFIPQRHINQKGFAHWIIPLVVIVLVSLVGVRLLTASHANPVLAANIAVPSSNAGVSVPSSGAYFGGTNGSDVSPLAGCAMPPASGGQAVEIPFFECKMQHEGQSSGYVMPLVRLYMSGDNACKDVSSLLPTTGKSGGSLYQLATTPGRKLVILSLKCGNWGTFASGNGTSSNDNAVKSVVDAVKAWKTPTVLVFGHEPENNSCYGNESYLGTPDEYRAASRQFSSDVRAEVSKTGATNISIGWILMGISYIDAKPYLVSHNMPIFPGSCSSLPKQDFNIPQMRNPENWYPGDDAIDWLLSDSYARIGKDFSDTMTPFYNWVSADCPLPAYQPKTNYSCTAARKSKPLGIGEYSAAGTSTQRADFYNSMANQVSNFPKIKAYAIWSSQVGGPNSSKVAWQVDYPVTTADPSSHTALRSFTSLSKLTYFNPRAGSVDAPPSVSVTYPASNANYHIRDVVNINATASDDRAITSVVFSYKLHTENSWTTIGSDAIAPYTATWNTSSLSAGVYDIRAIASDNHTPPQTATSAITVQLTSFTPPVVNKPDLVVTRVVSTPSSPTSGQAVIFGAYVKNQGTASVPTGKVIGVAFNVDGVKQTWSGTYSNGLAPGASMLLTANNGTAGLPSWKATRGAHTVQAWVNDLGRLDESNTDNNKLAFPLTVTSACSSWWHVWDWGWRAHHLTTCRM